MFTKRSLKEKFSSEWKRHYHVEIFAERGFQRRKCKVCNEYFWSLKEKETCGCEKYEFIGNPVTKKKTDYIETWKIFENFFAKHDHTPINRYPVIDRWRPDLFFTMASIQDFQRIDQGNMVFEYPAENLIVPQVCLRFNDIPNVGVTGRHHTSFIMSGQHSFGGYWKDRCIELNFKFLTEAMGIPEEEIVYKEDVWAMPDFSAFGPCIETFCLGLELANSVFMQFTKTGNTYKELPLKVIDVGWGHERLVWFSQGTPTGYDAVFGPVIKWMKKQSGLKENDLFRKYAALAGNMDIDEVHDIDKARLRIAKTLGVSLKELKEIVEPFQALYAIADHTKTLLFAITDAGIPSNTGGGYNLRVILRRALSFLKEFEFPFSLEKIAELHAKYLYPLFPELSENLNLFSKIIEVEKKRYEKTLKNAEIIIRKELKEGKLDNETLIKLYTSHGISPEMIEREAKKYGIAIEIPPDFYVKITEKHIAEEKTKKEEPKIDITGIPDTELLFYEKPYERDFEAKVLKKADSWIILNKTLFYPEGGGQPGDKGHLFTKDRKIPVTDVHKIGGIVIHKIEGSLQEGETVNGSIDWDRRYTLMKMHTATHIIAGSVRKIIGKHAWQAGAKKDLTVSRIDLTHYQPFTREEIMEIEKLANKIVSGKYPVETKVIPRSEAESKYGFTIYQGGASPGKEIRIVNVANGFDIEGCGGTHVKNTEEVELIKIV
ncbi:MAG: alanine--tRNA ligase, partial [Spirochaetes bacterium]